ncbi:MAG: methyltransferase domain-containing protein [Solirubrobacterales bacterium]
MTNPSRSAIERLLPLLAPEHRDDVDLSHGYVDVLGRDLEQPGLVGGLMQTGTVSRIYERWWRPALGRVAKGLTGPGMAEEKRIARLLMGLGPGDGVLDVACGPGNFTRDFARAVGEEGLAVGIDGSRPMLERAVRETHQSDIGNVVFVHGDATVLPFRDASFDAVCCFAALNLFAEPFGALDHMRRVLSRGGRIALFTSCRGRTGPVRTAEAALAATAGVRMFDRDEIVDALRDRGFSDVRQRTSGLTQFVGGRLP